MADTPKPGRGKPLSERFEVFEADPTAHLTEEQKKWKLVKLRSPHERFEVLENQHQAHEIEDSINELVDALNEAHITRGARRLTIDDIKHLIPAFVKEGA